MNFLGIIQNLILIGMIWGDDECCFACRHCDGWLIACTGTCGTKLGGWGTCWRFDGGYVGR